MNAMNRIIGTLGFMTIIVLTFSPVQSRADSGAQYCVTPPFINASIAPNVLMMLDNSSSMYDLAYADEGKSGTCSTTTTIACLSDSGCPSGQTCTGERQPYYCYDQTYNSANSYVGYFAPATYYRYRTATDDFAPVASAFPSGCPTDAANITKQIAGTMCLEYAPTTNTIVNFIAKGNYLNWLTASKFDIEKQILTGGKYVSKVCSTDASRSCNTDTDCAAGTCDATTPFLQSESRGCVGRSYIKDALTGDFANYAAGTANPNTKLNVTFAIRGPASMQNPTAPSMGGQTYIDLFAPNRVYDYGVCQTAVEAIATGTNAQIKTAVAACLDAQSGTCQNSPATVCYTSYPDCNLTLNPAKCSKNLNYPAGAAACSTTDASTCIIYGPLGCSLNSTRACTTVGATAPAQCYTPATYRCSYSSAASPVACAGAAATCTIANPGVKGTCSLSTFKCDSDFDCSRRGDGYCVGHIAAGSYACIQNTPAVNDGTCQNYDNVDYGPCTTTKYTGPCVYDAMTMATKQKVAFQQSMQACWQTREGHAIGPDDIQTVKNQCDEIYASYFTCDNNRLKTCLTNLDCGAGNCTNGPSAIQAGNPALLCGLSYEGQFYTGSGSTWALAGGNTDLMSALAIPLPSGCLSGDTLLECMIKIHTAFCSDMNATQVTDPTDDPSDTSVSENIPAILSGVGVESQLGAPVASLRVKIAEAPEPGLIQQFADRIRMGLMTFNFNGGASEVATGALATQRLCSNDLKKTCTLDVDCISPGICGGTGGTQYTTATTNLDGAKVVHPIGLGKCKKPCTVDTDCGISTCNADKYCASSSLAVCAINDTCSTGEKCISDGVGDHNAGFVRAVDDTKAWSWTPVAEAFYDAMGYFASPTTGNSRTTVRLNADDFPASLNPSQYRCQRNNVLLISDGASTADRSTTMTNVASLYSLAAGKPSGWVSTCPKYGGSKNLPVLAWLAKNRNIANFNLSGTASTASPPNLRDFISTYIVFNGASDGTNDECSSINLMNETATKGGSTMQQADNPSELKAALKSVFEQLSAKASSGTAASILSNSEGSGANILQAVFYPKKTFDNGATEVTWVGELQNLWYYIDPFIGKSSVREDTDYTAANLAAGADHRMNLRSDKVVQFNFNEATLETEAQLFKDADGDGGADATQPTGYPQTVSADQVNSLWRAGKKLWSRAAADRTIYTNTGSSLTSFTGLDVTAAANRALLNAASEAEATNIINYTKGIDLTGFRSRTIATTEGGTRNVWKLGDIISSTPRVESGVPLNNYHLPPIGGYNDLTYSAFVNTTAYKARGMAYVAANDGMMHAFRMGSLDVAPAGDLKATLSGADLGKEEWAFIPRHTLPYLKYLMDPDYTHMYTMDGASILLDASIGCGDANYWSCTKTADSWKTVLIGGMGTGGASRSSGDTCTAGANGTCVKTPVSGVGYSSYYALDVTTPTSPSLMWEFAGDFTVPAAPKYLGYATSGPASIRIKATNGAADDAKNGRWLAVFASGPTGPIDNCNFRGTSNQNLYLFVVDMKTGALVRTIDTGIQNAFAGTIGGGTIDTDRWNKGGTGFYQDNAIYIGYVNKDTGTGTWTDGGVLRLLVAEGEPANADNWHVNKLIDGIGPVTTTIAKLQDRKKHNMWLYFGTGRYFCSLDDMPTSDPPRRLFGVKDPCYHKDISANLTPNIPYPDTFDPACTDSIGTGVSNLTSKDSSGANSLNLLANKGWYRSLAGADSGFGAERLISDPVAMSNGVVFFTTYKPNADICEFGGKSYMWGVKYDTGSPPLCSSIQGKALVQVSTGAFEEIDLQDILGCLLPNGSYMPPIDPANPAGPRPPVHGDDLPPPTPGPGMTGKPPQAAPPIITKSNLKGMKKILHIRER